jgi:hypothetical protein
MRRQHPSQDEASLLHRIDDARKPVTLDAHQRANSALAKNENGQVGPPLFTFHSGITKEGHCGRRSHWRSEGPSKGQRPDNADGFSVARKLGDIGRGPK